MAPKKDKKPPEPAGPPPEWVATSRSAEFLKVEGATITHVRTGVSDVARGVKPLEAGKHRITYQINRTGSSKGYGIVLGVTDADAPAWSESLDFPASKPPPSRPVVAWGLSPSLGKLIDSPDAKAAKFGGGSIRAEEFPSIAPCANVKGTTIVFELNIPKQPEDDAAIVRRDFRACLHPLTVQRTYPLHLASMQSRGVDHLIGSPIGKTSTLSFSVDGGEMIATSVALPPRLWPWVHLSWQGDSVTLVSVESTLPETEEE